MRCSSTDHVSVGEHLYSMTKVRRDCADRLLQPTVTFQPFPAFFPHYYSTLNTGKQSLLHHSFWYFISCSSVSSLLSPYRSVFKQVFWRMLFISLSPFWGAVSLVQPFPLSPLNALLKSLPWTPCFCHMKLKLLVPMQRAPGTLSPLCLSLPHWWDLSSLWDGS